MSRFSTLAGRAYAARYGEGRRLKHFTPSHDPAEGLGVLTVFQLIEEAMPAFFQQGRAILVARAPGRLDVFGGLGGARSPLALALPTAEAACCAVQARDDELVRLWSPCRDGSRTQMLSVRLSDLGLPAAPIGYDEARAFLLADPRDRWAGYLVGALLVLARERAATPTCGADVLLHSDVPVRCGVGSSTAVTVAALRAFALLYGVELSAAELAQLAQAVERDLLQVDGRVGDSMAAVLAEAGEVLVLRGRTADVDARVPVPSWFEFVALETGTESDPVAVAPDDPAEHARVERFRELLQQEPSVANRTELGDLMFASHDAYGAAGLSNAACDLVVDFVRQRRAAGAGVLGARLSGRGGGGTVLLLGEHGKVWYEALRAKKALLEATGHSGHIFRWSSPGAMSFGSIELSPKA